MGRAVLWLSPVWITVLLLESFLWLAGETVPVGYVATKYDRTGPPAAYLPGLIGQQFSLLHYSRVVKLRPKLLVLGSSRVTRFRQEMFGPEVDFYNSGRTIACVGDLEQYVDALPADYHPEVLLLGVDNWWFKRNLPTPTRFADDIASDDVWRVSAHLSAYRRFFSLLRRGVVNGELIWRVITRQDRGIKRFGLMAWRSAGMRNDGSNQTFDRSTPKSYREVLPAKINDILRISHPALLSCPLADDELLTRFATAVKKLSDRGTTVIAFAPPFASEVLEAFADNPDQLGFHDSYKTKIEKIFKENHWYFFDGSDLGELGLDDRSMKDTDHAQETYHVALLTKMAEDPKVRTALHLKPLYLKSLLLDPDTTPWYPDFPAD
jgi:hypothetical protein